MWSWKVSKMLLVGVVAALTACGESSNVRAVKAEIASRLRDPESARWSNVREIHDSLVCGEVNGRNAFGAYAGAQKFYGVVSGEGVVASLVPADGSGDLCAMYEDAARQREANSQEK